jgi:hypothetical protein
MILPCNPFSYSIRRKGKKILIQLEEEAKKKKKKKKKKKRISILSRIQKSQFLNKGHMQLTNSCEALTTTRPRV